MIPISLYVTIELVKLAQVYFIQEDKHLYYEPANKPIECRALNITEDLGQVREKMEMVYSKHKIIILISFPPGCISTLYFFNW